MKPRKRVLTPRLSLSRHRMRTSEERAAILEEFRRRRLLDEQLNKIAKDLGVSLSTIFRWERESVSGKLNFFDIGEHIEKLCSDCRYGIESIRESYFNVCAFIRWPNDRVAQEIAVSVYISSYLMRRYGDIGLNYLPQQERALLDNYLTVGRLVEYFSGNGRKYADFYEHSDYWDGYADRNHLSDIIHYFIDDENFGRKNKKTLDNFYNLTDEGSLGRGFYKSRSSFQTLWSGNAASSPFHFVDEYVSDINWFLNPTDADFVECVEFACANRRERVAYFSTCLWVMNVLRERLDVRAFTKIRFPTLPDNLAPIPLTHLPSAYDMDR